MALACGLIPLGIGTVVFVLFLIFRTEDFALFGFLTILVGSCLAGVGFVCLCVYFYQSRRAAPDDAAIARRRVQFDLGVIVANFSIAFGMAWLGLWLMSRVTITVHNRDAVPIGDVHVATNYGGTHNLGTIAPHNTKAITLSDKDFDELQFNYVQNGVQYQETINQYAVEVEDGTMGLAIEKGKLVAE